MSMAAKSSDLVDKMSGANLQVDGHAEVPTQGAKDLRKLKEEDSSPSCLHLGIQLGGCCLATLI